MGVDFVDDSHPTKNLYFRGDKTFPNPSKEEDSVQWRTGI
jgi:hypothetical protein